MKKRILFLIVILFINVISASYSCSDGALITERDLIEVGEIEFINGINLGIFGSGVISADLLIDAKHFSLTNESSSKEIELLSGNYNVSLINLTGNLVGINVESHNGEIEGGELEEIGDLQVYALRLEGTYPGADADVELLAGRYYQFLYNTKPTVTKTIEDVEFLFELSSSSSRGAVINVKKCENGTLIEINDSVGEDSNETNVDNSSLQNKSIQNQSSINNDTTNMSNLTASEDSQDSNNILDFLKQNLYYALGVILILVVIFIVFSYKKKKREQEVLKDLQKVKNAYATANKNK